MSTAEEINNKRERIIKLCYDCYVEKGLENASVRDFCRCGNLNPNTIYYYFKDKDEILFECVNYGYMKLEEAMFDVVDNADSAVLFSELIDGWTAFSHELRFLYQAVSSPSYDRHRQQQFVKLNEFYDRFGERLAQRLECPYELIHLNFRDILRLMSYYSLWGSENVPTDHFMKCFNDLMHVVDEYKNNRSSAE